MCFHTTYLSSRTCIIGLYINMETPTVFLVVVFLTHSLVLEASTTHESNDENLKNLVMSLSEEIKAQNKDINFLKAQNEDIIDKNEKLMEEMQEIQKQSDEVERQSHEIARLKEALTRMLFSSYNVLYH